MSPSSKNVVIAVGGLVLSSAIGAAVSNAMTTMRTMPVIENRMANVEEAQREQQQDFRKAIERLDSRIAVQESINNSLQARLLSEIGDMKQTLGRVEGQLDMLTRRADAADVGTRTYATR